MPALSVIVPVQNEEPAIAGVLEELHTVLASAPEVTAFEILVVDDGSMDGTAEAVRVAAESRPAIHLLTRDRNSGYGAAIKYGLQHAAHDLVAIIDGDGSYPAEKIPEMLRGMGDAAMVVGARSRTGAVPLLRRPAKWLLTRLASFLAEQKIPDLNSGLRIFRKEACLRFVRLLPQRFSFTTTLTLAMLCDEIPVKFFPIDYRPRAGLSKIRPIRDTFAFLMLIITTITYFRPLKIVGPLAFFLVLAGVVKGLSNLLFPDNPEHRPSLKTTDLLLIVSGIQVFALALLADLISKRR